MAISTKEKPHIVILGSGNSGHAMAASFAMQRYPVTLVSLTGKNSRRGYHKGGLSCHFEGRETRQSIYYSDEIEESIASADIIFCLVPALHHALISQRLLANVHDGQMIYFSAYFGAIKFLEQLNRTREKHDITIIESMSAVHASRSSRHGDVAVLSVKDKVPVAAYPADRLDNFLEKVKPALPCLVPSENILFTSLNNVGPILHVPLMILNAARIEMTKGQGWDLYREGLTPAVQSLVQQLDAERRVVAEHLGIRALAIEEIMLNYFYQKQHSGSDNFWDWIRTNTIHASKRIGTPDSIRSRYLTEGLYYGLQPLNEIAEYCEIDVPSIRHALAIGDIILNNQQSHTDVQVESFPVELLELFHQGEALKQVA